MFLEGTLLSLQSSSSQQFGTHCRSVSSPESKGSDPAMAVASYRSSSITMKAVVLSVMLVLLCLAAAVAPSFAAAPATTSEASLGRRLLAINLCGPGSAPNFNCARILPLANKPACCSDLLGLTQFCVDVGSILINRCGSCTTTCPFGSICCKGVCANLLTDPKNCGICGRVCPGNLPCTFGLCRYGI